MLNYQRVVPVPLGSFRILWACHTSLKKWCQDASFGHVRWWHGFDHHSDSRWCSSGAGPRSRSHSGFWPWEWLWVTTCTKQVSKICFVCISVYACPGYWCSYYVSTRFCQPQSTPTSLSAWHWKRCDFYLQRGSSLGARVCGSIASTHPSSSRLGSLTCAFWIRSCLPCDTLLSSEGEYKNKYQKDSKSNKMMKKLHETDK